MGGFYNVDKTTGELIPVAGATLYADLPVGSWVKNDMGIIPTGFLKEGDSISQSEYPDLYTKYGSTVPYMADTSELSEYETITISTSSSSPTVMTYDGYLTVYATGGPRGIYINGVKVANATPTGDLDASVTVAVKKGDQIYFTNYFTNCCRGAFYKKSLILKAKSTGAPTDIIEGVASAINSYSTEETLTGGTWIDGKPIYRKVISVNTIEVTDTTNWIDFVTNPASNFGELLDCKMLEKRSGATLTNYNFIARYNETTSKIQLLLSRGLAVDITRYIVVEYTKTTD